MKRLAIAEKPSLAQAVIDVLPGTASKSGVITEIGDWYFVPLAGHILEQEMPDFYLPDDVPLSKSGSKIWRAQDLPIIPSKWAMKPREDTLRNLNAIKALLPKVDEIIHLGDPDAEGQLLVDEVLLYLGNTAPVKRLLINDYNETKVRQSLADIRDNNDPQFRSWFLWARARSYYDWLFGLNLTRAATIRARALGYQGLLTVGSVQTPLLKIVVDRDRAIENFKPIPYYTLAAQFQHPKGAFNARWKAKEGQPGLDEANRLTNTKIAQDLAAKITGKQATITVYKKTQRTEAPPLTLSMNELAMDACKAYGYTGQQVLDAAQTLYDSPHKLTTYPRSENRYLSEAQHADAPEILAALKNNLPGMAGIIEKADPKRKSPAFDDKQMDGNPHHGIVPTTRRADISGLSEIEKNIYDMIVRSYLAQFFPPCVFMQTEIELVSEGERFVTSGKTPVSPGWREIYKPPESAGDEEKEADGGKQTLPAMEKDDLANCIKCEATPKATTPPAYFDEGTLLDAMVNLYKYVDDPAAKARLAQPVGTGPKAKPAGIGTSATRAPLMKNLRDIEFFVPVKGSKTKFKSSAGVRGLIDALPNVVKDPAMAGVFKMALDSVAIGKVSFDTFLERTTAFVTKVCGDLRTAEMKLPMAPTVPCPQCKSGLLTQRTGSKGKFWSCSNYNPEPPTPPCKAIYNDANGKPQLLALPEVTCPKCKSGKLRRVKGGKGHFWSCSNYKAEPKCDASYNDRGGKPVLTTTGMKKAPAQGAKK